jgi:serine/threonine protein kinase/tetratricopeptide (TPR) repeat protein
MSPHEQGQVNLQTAPVAAVDTPCSEQDDPRVTRAALEYLDALRAGRRPDRQQFLARHPDIALALAECLDGLEFIHAAASQLHRSAAASPPGPSAGPTDHPAPANLGDYRILREIGRGGMGIVYEAEQLSLGRRVALKVLPFAATLDPKQLQRFKNEAQAAAQLRHPNIVPVYAVGEERGVHYYAMQLIDGQSLARLIWEQRQFAGLEALDAEASAACSAGQATPAGATRSTERSATDPAFFRTVAALGIQAALALEHAHQLGVVHRDIKPANLLVDGAGQLWVTDFGLAHVQSQAGLTMTGDLVGTLRYMSPEQALARPVIVDQRTDIYSLGATLYELLTLEPAFPGRDRQELLRRIATEDPRPPRRLGAAIPPDLVTIVLKAMSKEPEGRYVTAQDLADDLRRFLEDRPITARNPGLGQRAAKWARRHRAAVVCATVVLFVSSLALALSMVLIQVAHRSAELKTVEQRDAARRAVDDMYTDVAERWLEMEPEMEEVQRKFLLKALRYYEGFAQEKGTDPEVRFATAQAYRRVGDIQQKLGDLSSAEPAYREAIRLLARLTGDFPDRSEYRTALGHCHHNLGGLLTHAKRREEAEGAYRRAVALREQLLEESPASSQHCYDLAASTTALGRVLHGYGRRQDAERQYHKALHLLEGGHASGEGPGSQLHQDVAYQHLFATTQCHLADLHWSSGQVARTRQLLEMAIGYQRRAFKFQPRHPRYRKYLAVLLASLGRTRVRLGELAEAEEAYCQALALQENLARDFPGTPLYRSELAGLHLGLGDVLLARGRRQDASKAYAQVVAIRKQLVREFPPSPGHCRDLAWFLVTCPDPDLWDAAHAARLARQAVELAPRGGDCWRALGVACYRAKDWQGAVTALQKAMHFRSGGDGWEWFFLAMSHWQLGDKQQARTWYDRAIQWTDQNRPRDENLRRCRAEAAALIDGTDNAPPKGKQLPARE